MTSDLIKLFVTVDTRRGVVALKELGDQGASTARKLEEDNSKTSKSFDDVHKSTGRLHSGISMLAGAVGIGGLAFGLKDVITAGQQWQVQQAALQVALKNTGAGGQKTLDMLSKAAEGASVHGGFAAPQELTALTQFINLTGNATKAQQLNTAAMNLARGAHLGYTQTQRMLGQVLTGNVGRLQRYLGIIQPVKTAETALSQAHKVNVFQLQLQAAALGKAGPLWLKQQELIHGLTPEMTQHAQLLDKQATAQKVLMLIQQRYGGQTAAYSRTVAGGMNNLKDTLEVLATSLGTALLPAVKAVIGVLASMAQWMAKHKTLVLVLVGVIGGLTAAYYAIAAATAAWTTVTTIGTTVMTVASGAMGLLLDAVGFLRMGFIMMGMDAAAAWIAATGGIILLVAGLAWVATHFRQFKQIVGAVWDWMKGAVMDVVNFIAKHWSLILAILTGPIGLAVRWIVQHITGIEKAFGAVWTGIENLAKPVFNWIISKLEWIINKVLWLPRELAKLNPLATHVSGDTSNPALMNQLRAKAAAAGIAIPKYATGGTVGGFGPVDSQLALVTPGEGVLNRGAMQRIGGNQGLNAINAGGHLAGGGSSASNDVITIQQPVVLKIGQRVIAESSAIFSLRKSALS